MKTARLPGLAVALGLALTAGCVAMRSAEESTMVIETRGDSPDSRKHAWIPSEHAEATTLRVDVRIDPSTRPMWMLVGLIRQARRIMNPTSFAAHDDGGTHTAMALLQTGLMLPEFADSAAWRCVAGERWETVLDIQFHADGSHCSLSTGYAWASICALENRAASSGAPAVRCRRTSSVPLGRRMCTRWH